MELSRKNFRKICIMIKFRKSSSLFFEHSLSPVFVFNIIENGIQIKNNPQSSMTLWIVFI